MALVQPLPEHVDPNGPGPHQRTYQVQIKRPSRNIRYYGEYPCWCAAQVQAISLIMNEPDATWIRIVNCCQGPHPRARELEPCIVYDGSSVVE